MRTLVVEGDTVRQGQPLAIISSRDVLTMGADLTRANARAGVARSNAARLSQLAREGIIAGARADEANALAAEAGADVAEKARSEEHTSELQSLMRISYAVFRLKKKTTKQTTTSTNHYTLRMLIY